MNTYSEKDYLGLYARRRVEGGHGAWLEASQDVLRAFLSGTTDSIDIHSSTFSDGVAALSSAWTEEGRCALITAAYCFWSDVIAKIPAGARPKEYYPVLYNVLRSRADSGELKNVCDTFALAVLAHKSAPKPEEYRDFERELFVKIQKRVLADEEIQKARELWPSVLLKDGSFKPACAIDDMALSREVRVQIAALDPSAIGQRLVEMTVASAKGLYPECFKTLPHIHCEVFDPDDPANKGRPSGNYDYLPPGEVHPWRTTGFGFSQADTMLATLPAFLDGVIHETEHVLQSHLAWLVDTGQLKPEHPLYMAARTFNTWNSDLANNDGAKLNYPLPLRQRVANMKEMYMEAPREWWAWRLGNALSAVLRKAWDIPRIAKRLQFTDENYLLEKNGPKTPLLHASVKQDRFEL